MKNYEKQGHCVPCNNRAQSQTLERKKIYTTCEGESGYYILMKGLSNLSVDFKNVIAPEWIDLFACSGRQ